MKSTFLMRNPFAELAGEIDRFFGNAASYRSSYPSLDVSETDDSYEVRAFLPGVPKEAIEVELDRNVLKIKGKVERQEEEGAVYHIRERFTGEFERSFRLGAPLASDSVKAEYRDGVLTLSIRKAEEARPRQIEIS